MNNLLPFLFLVLQIIVIFLVIIAPFALFSAYKQSKKIELIDEMTDDFSDEEFKVYIGRCRNYLKSKGKKTIY